MNTQSGMEKPILSELPAIPRTCGGDPMGDYQNAIINAYSPHMRG